MRDRRPRDRERAPRSWRSTCASSHHACPPNVRLMPLNTLRRPKSGLSFFIVGCKPDLAEADDRRRSPSSRAASGTTIADALPRGVGRELHRAGLARGARSRGPCRGARRASRSRPASTRHLQQDDRREHAGPRREVRRLGDLALLARLLDAAAESVPRSSASCRRPSVEAPRRGQWPSGATASRTRLPSAGEIERERDRDDDQRDDRRAAGTRARTR